MAKQLVAAMSGEFNADDYKDEYREALMAVIEAKIAGQPVEVPARRRRTKITDLMSVLEASLAAGQGRQDERCNRDLGGACLHCRWPSAQEGRA